MELFLNLVWLAVAIAVSVSLALHNRARTRRPSAFILAVTIVCIIFLLFPPISMSDDLHDLHCAMEDSSRKCVSPLQTVQLAVAPAIGLLALTEFRPSLRILARLSSEGPRLRTLHGFFSLSEGRAPPMAAAR